MLADIRPRSRYLAVILLIASTLLVYGGTMDHPFIAFDDNDYVYKNPRVQEGLTADGIRWAFTSFAAANYHPLTWISHMADVSLFGMDAGKHHLVNVAFHAANSVLLFLLLSRMTGAWRRSAFVAALFALHPLHVQSVAWIAERKDLLCAFFFLLTLAAYRRYVERPGIARYLAVAALFLLALLAKPMAVTLPFVLLLLDYWPLGGGRALRTLLAEKVPLLLMSAASCAVTIVAQSSGETIVSLQETSSFWRIANVLVAYATYLLQTVWPSGLAVNYPHPGSTLPRWSILASIVLLAGISTLAARNRKRRAWLATGWLWYLGMLVPVIGIVQVGAQARADRYTYLPLIGIFLIAAWGAEEIARRYKVPEKVSAAIAGAVLVALAGAAWVQVGYWQDSATIFSRALEVTDRNWLVHINLGTVLFEERKDAEALGHFQEALKFEPGHPYARNDAGVALQNLGRRDEAILQFREAIRLKPDYPAPNANLGYLLSERGEHAEAISLCREAVRLGPDLPGGHSDLGYALMRAGHLDEAVGQFRETLRLSPSHASAEKGLREALGRIGAK
jgi:Flp pilus assembly protein TadD